MLKQPFETHINSSKWFQKTSAWPACACPCNSDCLAGVQVLWHSLSEQRPGHLTNPPGQFSTKIRSVAFSFTSYKCDESQGIFNRFQPPAAKLRLDSFLLSSSATQSGDAEGFGHLKQEPFD